MKKIYIHILAVAVAVVTLTACEMEDNDPDAGNIAPSFTATIEGGLSRVIGCDWESDDQIGISCTSVSATNVCHITSDGSGRFVVEDISKKIFFKSTLNTTSSWTFNAYYPWTQSATVNLSVKTSDQSDQKSFDFLFAQASCTKEFPFVNFNFTHKLSKVTLVLKNGQNFDVRNIKSYILGDLYMNGTFNITSGTCSPSTSGTANKPTTVSMDLSGFDVEDSKPLPHLILIPQTIQASGTATSPRPVKLELECYDGQLLEAILSFPNDKLEAGKNYKFTIYVNKTGLNVISCTIEDWNPIEGGQGSADSADDPEEELAF